MRWYSGQHSLVRHLQLARWSRREVERLRPSRLYALAEVALESLRWARASGVPTVLDRPTGHIARFAEVCGRESRRWIGVPYRGDPHPHLVARVEEEYELADRIRVSSTWSRDTLVARGVAPSKIDVVT